MELSCRSEKDENHVKKAGFSYPLCSDGFSSTVCFCVTFAMFVFLVYCLSKTVVQTQLK